MNQRKRVSSSRAMQSILWKSFLNKSFVCFKVAAVWVRFQAPPPDITTPRAAATTQVDKSPATTVPGSPALGGEVAKAGVPREADKSPEEEDSWPEDLYPFPEETPGGAVTAPASTPKGTTCDKGSHSHTRGKAYVGKISSCYDKYKDGSYWKILG